MFQGQSVRTLRVDLLLFDSEPVGTGYISFFHEDPFGEMTSTRERVSMSPSSTSTCVVLVLSLGQSRLSRDGFPMSPPPFEVLIGSSLGSQCFPDDNFSGPTLWV